MALDLTERVRPTPTVALSSDYTEAMSMLASGVVMVTSRLDGRPWGMTISAFASVSDEPPTILVSLGSGTASASAILAAGSFGVSVLGRHHGAAARHGSTRGASKFLERFVDRHSRDSSPAITGALAHLDCEVTEQISVADHTIFVGRVRNVRIAEGGEPLVYFRRAYRALAPCNPSFERRIPCLSS